MSVNREIDERSVRLSFGLPLARLPRSTVVRFNVGSPRRLTVVHLALGPLQNTYGQSASPWKGYPILTLYGIGHWSLGSLASTRIVGPLPKNLGAFYTLPGKRLDV